MSAFQDARGEIHKSAKESDKATLGWISMLPAIIRKHWEVPVVLAYATYGDGLQTRWTFESLGDYIESYTGSLSGIV